MSSVNDELAVQIGYKFESEKEVMPKVKSVLDKISNSTNVEVHFGVDKNELNKILESTAKINKTSIQLDQDGKTLQSIVEINTGLNQTLKLIENAKGTKININNDFAKNENLAYNESLKLLQQEYQIKTQLLTAEGQYKDILSEQLILNQKIQKATIDDSMGNRLLAEKVALNEKYQQSVSKVSDQRNKQIQKDKEEQAEMQRLIALEKQRLNNKIALYSNKYKGNEDVQSLNRITNAIENLGKSSTNLKSLKKEFQDVSQEIKNMETSTKVATGNISKHDDMSFINNLKANITSLASYFMSGSLLYSIGNTFREATSYVIELDSAMINLKKVTDETDYTYKNFLNTAHEISMEFGSQSDKVVNAVTNWAKMGKTLEESTKLAESTMLLSKVGDVENMDTASKLMVAPLTAFNIEAEKSIDLIDKYNNISNNMATTTKDVGEGLSRSASSMATAGNSLDETIALLAVAEAKTKQGGESVGTALRTISLRLASFKDDETGETIVKLAEDLQKLGVQATDSSGQIRSTFDILMDLSKVWNDLDRNTQLSLSEKIGGKRQSNYVSAILSDTKELQRAFELSQNSAGSATQEFEKYQESIQYSVDRLKEQMNELYTNMVNSDFLKGFAETGVSVLNTLNNLSDSFGLLPSVITLASTAFLMFNKNANNSLVAIMNSTKGIGLLQTKLTGLESKFTSQISYLRGNIEKFQQLILAQKTAGLSTSGLGTRLLGLNIKLALTEVKLIATKIATIALQTALSFGLSLAITGAITGLSKLASNLYASEKSMDDCKESAKALADTLNETKTNDKLFIDYKDITSQLQNINLSEEKRNELNEKLEGIKQQIYSVDDNAYAIINNQNLSLQEQLSLLQDINEEKKFQQADKLDTDMLGQDAMEQKAKGMEYLMSSILQMQERIKTLQSTGGSETEIKGLNENINKFKNDLRGLGIDINTYNSNINLMKDANYNTSRSTIEMSDKVKGFIETLSSSTQAINDNTIAKEKNNGVITGTMTKDEATANVQEATKMYGEANTKANELRETLKKINEDGLSSDMVSELASKYSDLGYRVNDVAEVQSYLNSKIEEQVSASQSAYATMIANDNQFYETKIANNESFKNLLNEYLNSFVGDSQGAYNVDLNNFANLQDLKNSLQNQFGDKTNSFIQSYLDIYTTAYSFDSSQYADLQSAKTGMLNAVLDKVAIWASQFVGANAQSYSKDLKNFNSLAGAKSQVLADLNERMKLIQNNYNDLLSSAQQLSRENGGGDFEGSRALSNASKQLRDIKGAISGVDRIFEGIEISVNKMSSNFNPSSFKGGGIGSSGSSGSKGGGSGSGSGSKATQQRIEDIENLTDRYYDLNEAMSSVENALSNLNTEMENANDKEKVKLLEKEINLYNQKRTALQNLLKEQQKEANEYRNNTLGKAGFKFNVDGSISNYSQRMNALQSWANSFSDTDDRKKEAQEYYKEISKLTEDYFSLIKKTIPETQNKIDDIKNETISAQKEIADILKKQKDDYKKNLEEETDKLKSEIQKRKELMNKSFKEEDKADEMAEKQKKLNELEAELTRALRTGDESMAYSIRQQIAEAQAEINKFITESERDLANETFDKALDAEDEALKAKLDQIEKELGDEDILALVISGTRDLSDALNNIDKSTNGVNRSFAFVGDTVANVGDIIRTSWVGGLQSFIDKAKEAMDIVPNLISAKVDVNQNSVANKQNEQGKTVYVQPGQVSINGANKEDIRREMYKMTDEVIDQVVKLLDN